MIKIADFGLAKDVSNKEYDRDENTDKPIPIRWMSAEAIEFGTFTLQSDMVKIKSYFRQSMFSAYIKYLFHAQAYI